MNLWIHGRICIFGQSFHSVANLCLTLSNLHVSIADRQGFFHHSVFFHVFIWLRACSWDLTIHLSSVNESIHVYVDLSNHHLTSNKRVISNPDKHLESAWIYQLDCVHRSSYDREFTVFPIHTNILQIILLRQLNLLLRGESYRRFVCVKRWREERNPKLNWLSVLR